jgi:GPH family glycoside/pentoside/hexuronide:cation symporter
MGLVFGVLVVLCTMRISESAASQGRGGTGLVASFRDVATNPHALLLFFLLGIESFGMGIVATLAAYIMDDLVRRPDLLEMLLACWMIPQFLLVPFWIRLSARFGKKALWIFGLSCMLGGFAGQFFLEENAWPLVFGCVILLGTGGSIANVIGPSIQADVVDYDEMKTGERKEGAYTAVWNFIRKAGSALAAGVGGFVLSATGYDPAAELQSEAVRDGIRYTVGIFPACIYLIALVVMTRFSLDEAEHEKVVATIRARARESDPE